MMSLFPSASKFFFFSFLFIRTEERLNKKIRGKETTGSQTWKWVELERYESNLKFGNDERENRGEEWEPVWERFFVNQFPSLNFYLSLYITHFFYTHLATSLLFSSLNFFTLFMNPTSVSRYSFFFLIPNSLKLI